MILRIVILDSKNRRTKKKKKKKKNVYNWDNSYNLKFRLFNFSFYNLFLFSLTMKICLYIFSIDFNCILHERIIKLINSIFYIQYSIPGHVISKTLKMVLDDALLNTQQYNVLIKGKVEQSRGRSSTPYISV